MIPAEGPIGVGVTCCDSCSEAPVIDRPGPIALLSRLSGRNTSEFEIPEGLRH